MRERRGARTRPYRRFGGPTPMTQLPVFDPTHEWQNFHQTYTQIQQGSWDVYFPNLGGAVTTIEDLKETTRQLQALIGEARQSMTPIRAIGSRWSFSRPPGALGRGRHT